MTAMKEQGYGGTRGDRAGGARMVVVRTLERRQALGLPWENSFVTLVALVPASAHCHWPRSKDQGPELCFLGAPPSQRVCGPRHGAGVAEKGRPGQSKTQEQPWEPACQQLLTPQAGLPNLPLPILRGGRCYPVPACQQAGLQGGRARVAAAFRALLRPTHPPPRGAGKQGSGAREEQAAARRERSS